MLTNWWTGRTKSMEVIKVVHQKGHTIIPCCDPLAVVTHLFGTSNFICSWTHPRLLFSGLGPLFLLFILLFSQPILLNLTRGAWRPSTRLSLISAWSYTELIWHQSRVPSPRRRLHAISYPITTILRVSRDDAVSILILAMMSSTFVNWRE